MVFASSVKWAWVLRNSSNDISKCFGQRLVSWEGEEGYLLAFLSSSLCQLPEAVSYCISNPVCGKECSCIVFISCRNPKTCFPYTSVVQLMLRGMWQSITLNHIYMSSLQCGDCASYHHMLLEAKAENNFLSFVSSLVCFQFKYKDFIT